MRIKKNIFAVSLIVLPLLLLPDSDNEGYDEYEKIGRDSSNQKFRSVSNYAFRNGERLVFDINYGRIKAGEGEMIIPEKTDINGRDVLRVQIKARSVSPFSWVYRVEDLWETYIDKEGLFPWRYSERIREGGYRRDTDVEFDHHNSVAITNRGEYQIPLYVHDMVSALYYVRTIDFSALEAGDIVELKNFHRDSTYTMGILFHGREEVRVKTGTFNTLVIEPLIQEGGLFKHEGAIHIWLTDDNLKVPVRMRSRIPVGSITAELRHYTGLRDAIRARIP